MALKKTWSGNRFRTRDPRRDTASDVRRLQQVRDALTTALDAARREQDGLQRRVDRGYGQAASPLDEAGEYDSLPATEEAGIAEAERHADAALARVQGLKGQIALFERLLGELDEAMARQGAATTA
jgi:hypothetical protein